MFYTEDYRDLFSLTRYNIMLVHCVSADYKLGAGIAKKFQDKYGIRDKLLAYEQSYPWDGHGGCRIIKTKNECGDDLFVANLVTKQHYYDKPTYETMEESLIDLKQQLIEHYPSITSLGMPTIGCGLDRLEWYKVSDIITRVFGFGDTHFRIFVCKNNCIPR